MRTEEEIYKDFEVGELVSAKIKIGSGEASIEGHIMRIGRHSGVLCASIKDERGKAIVVKMSDITKTARANIH